MLQLKVKIIDAIRDGFLRNPIAWILLALFAVAEYGNYQTGYDINRLCGLLGSHDVSMLHPRTAKEQIDNICISYQPADSPNDQ